MTMTAHPKTDNNNSISYQKLDFQLAGTIVFNSSEIATIHVNLIKKTFPPMNED